MIKLRDNKLLRIAMWLTLAIVFVLLLLMGVLGMLANERSFRWLTSNVANISAGMVSIGGSSGSLNEQGQLTDVQILTKTSQINISSVAWHWQPAQLRQWQVMIDEIALGEMTLRQLATSPFAPMTPPTYLDLPIPVTVKRISLAKLNVLPKGQVFTQLEASFNYQRRSDGHQHTITIDQFNTPWGTLNGNVQLGAQMPFVVRGEMNMSGNFQKRPWHSNLQLAGNLYNLNATGDLSGIANGHVQAKINSFSKTPLAIIQSLDLRLLSFNPKVYGVLPQNALLNVAVILTPTEQGYQGGLSVVNENPGEFNSGRLPVSLIVGGVDLHQDQLSIHQLTAHLLQGQVVTEGNLSLEKVSLAMQLQNIGYSQWLGKIDNNLLDAKQKQNVNGTIAASGSWYEPTLNWNLVGTGLLQPIAFTGQLAVEGKDNQLINLKSLVLRQANNTFLNVSGQYDFRHQGKLAFSGGLNHFNPGALVKNSPLGDINAKFELKGNLASNAAEKILPHLAGQFQFLPSKLAAQPVQGTARFEMNNQQLDALNAQFLVAGNKLNAIGKWDFNPNNSSKNNSIKFTVDAPQLGILGNGFAGRIQGFADLAGTLSAPQLSADLAARDLQLPFNIRAAKLRLVGRIQQDGDIPFNISLEGEKLSLLDYKSERLLFKGEGTRSAHRVMAEGQVGWTTFHYKLALNAEGGLKGDTPLWDGMVRNLEATSHSADYPSIKLMAPARMQIGSGYFNSQALQFSALNGVVHLQDIMVQNQPNGKFSVKSNGYAEHIDIKALNAVYPLVWNDNLVLNSRWQVNWENTNALALSKIWVKRVSGDVKFHTLGGTDLPLRLSDIALYSEIQGQNALYQINADSTFGHIDGKGRWSLPDKANNIPVLGQFNVKLARLLLISLFLDQAYELDGQVYGALALSGTLQDPKINGVLRGKDLVYGEYSSGLRLVGGEMEATLREDRVDLNMLRFKNSSKKIVRDGVLEVKGSYLFAQQNLALQVNLNRYNLINRPESVLFASGQAQLTVSPGALDLKGKITANYGKYSLPDASAPSLSNDVHVIKDEAPEPARTRLPITIQLTLDLGKHFTLTGKGLSAALSGGVTLTKSPEDKADTPFLLHGDINIDEGRYRAYGQDLNVSKGVISFNGPYDNPILSFIAKRHLSPVGAGIEITGPLSQPQIRFVADDAMDDRDKFSWLVLGHAATNTDTDNAGLSAAAASLLVGGVNDKIGLFDDVGINQRKARYLADGSPSPAEQVFVLGKQITQKVYLGYEYGINTAKQAAKLVYSINRFWSAVLTAGQISSQVESRWSWRFD